MLRALTALFVCQLAGEALVRAAGIAFPGPVLGMGLMLAALILLGGPDAGLDQVADGFLRNLSILFVPAAVGVVQQAPLLAAEWQAIAAALIVSTLATLIVTVAVFRAVARWQERRR